jgi:hypothetical protein
MQLPRTHFSGAQLVARGEDQVRSYLLEVPPLIVFLWKLKKFFMLPLIMEE